MTPTTSTPMLAPAGAVEPYWSDATTRLYRGEALDVLGRMAPDSVHAVVTSPSYYGLRDYATGRWVGGAPDCGHSTARGTNTPQTKNPQVAYPASAHRGGSPKLCARCGAQRLDQQIGLENSPTDYVDALRAVFGEIRRVLRPDGAVWLNLGDTYNTRAVVRDSSHQPGAHPHRGDDHPTIARSWAENRRTGTIRMPSDEIAEKNLFGMPWRVAFALQADGWWLRSAVVWHKTNAMPESVTDRPSSRYEHVFLLTRSAHYWFDLDAIRQPHKPSTRLRVQRHRADPGRAHREGQPYHGLGGAQTFRLAQMAHPRGANPGNVWSIPASGYRGAHFATFPLELARRCVASACPRDGVVLDPFVGAGTTLLAAAELGRAGVGIDLSVDYLDLARGRIATRPTPTTGQEAA